MRLRGGVVYDVKVLFWRRMEVEERSALQRRAECYSLLLRYRFMVDAVL